MNGLRYLLAIGVAGLVAAPAFTSAQTGSSDTTPSVTARQREGRVLVPERVLPPELTATPPPSAVTVRPTRPVWDPVSPEVKERLQAFEAYRKQYLKRQEELRRQLQGATDQDRERIRAQVQQFRQEWREQVRSGQRDMMEQRRELLRRLPGHRELLEDLRQETRQAVRDLKERRGAD